MSDAPELPSKLKINLNLLRAASGFGLAWFFWRLDSDWFWVSDFFSVVLLIAGTKRFLVALYQITRHILAERERNRLKAKGNDPKADKMATRDDLAKRGML